MEALIASFLESLMPAAVGGSEAVIGGGASPMSFGDTLGAFAQNQVGQQMAPAMDVYNTMSNPNSTMGDMANSAFKYSFNPKGSVRSITDNAIGTYGGVYINGNKLNISCPYSSSVVVFSYLCSILSNILLCST